MVQRRGAVVWFEGNIGAGKSSLTATVARLLDAQAMHEPVKSNPYLDLFYSDQQRWGYSMQVHMLQERYRLQRLAAEFAANGTTALLDRGLPGDRVFCRMLTDDGIISELEWETYNRFYEIMCLGLPTPTLIVFLDVSPEICLRRIQTRGRAVEAGIPLDYLRKVDAGYRDLLVEIESGRHTWSRGMKVLRYPWNSHDQPINDLVREMCHALHIDTIPEMPDKLRVLDDGLCGDEG